MHRVDGVASVPRGDDASFGMSFGDFFLTNPDLFPARDAGEPWGSSTVTLDFAGGGYRFEGLSEDQARAVAERFAPLAAVPASATVVTRVFRAPESDFRRFELRGWQTRMDLESEDWGVRVAGRDVMARMSRPIERAALWTCHDAGSDFLGGLENLFRLLVAYRVAAEGGVVLHSAGVLGEDGAARLFVGPSGTGKTTLCRLSAAAGRVILSDELNAILWEGDRPVVERLPFAGDFGGAIARRERFPLAGLFRLRQGSDNSRAPLGGAAGVGALAGSSPALNADPFAADRLLANLERVAGVLPIETLTFTLERDGRDLWGTLAA